MLLENIPLYFIAIILFVLVYAFNDSWVAEIILIFFAVAFAYQAVPSIATEYDGIQVLFLAVAVPLYAVANLIDWATNKKGVT